MALFTDSHIIAAEQMIALDGEVGAVSASNKVDPGAAIRNAWSESAQFLTSRLQSYSGQMSAGYWGNTSFLNAYGNANFPRVRLSNIVATCWDYAGAQSPIESWLLYSALYLFYRDASTRKAKDDRLSAKTAQYLNEKKAAWSRIEAVGVPIVINPLPAPGALHEPNAGSWGATNLTTAGASNSPLSYDFAVTWMGNGSLSSNANNSESGPSARATLQFAPGQTLTASIASLIPPTGNYSASVGYASGITTGQVAIGWNLYAGPAGGQLTLQNASVLPLTSPTVALTAFLTGPKYLGSGQFPTESLPFARHISRF